MQTTMQELVSFSNSIVLLFSVDILRRNNMVDTVKQEDRELLYSCHMYRQILLQLDLPHHFQSKSCQWVLFQQICIHFNLSNRTSPPSCFIIIPTPSVVAVDPVYISILKKYFQNFKIIWNTRWFIDKTIVVSPFKHWVIDDFKPTRFIIVGNIDAKRILQIKKKRVLIPPHAAFPCSLYQPTQKCAKPELVRWTKFAEKEKKLPYELNFSDLCWKLFYIFIN